MKNNFYALCNLLEENKEEDFKRKSIEIARLQRIKPEQKMLVIQRIMGGGVISVVVEHAGDLIHRANEKVTWETAGYEYVKEKVNRVLRYLTNDYGFEKEFQENIKHNAENMKVDIDVFKRKVYESLLEYGAEHEKLPAYNECQKTMKEICFSIGKRDWESAVKRLKILDNYNALKL